MGDIALMQADKLRSPNALKTIEKYVLRLFPLFGSAAKEY